MARMFVLFFYQIKENRFRVWFRHCVYENVSYWRNWWL